MRTFLIHLLFIGLISMFLACERNNPIDEAGTKPNFANHYIVLLNVPESDEALNPGSMELYVLKFLETHNIARSKVTHIYSSVVLGFSGYLTKEEVEKLKNDPMVGLIDLDKPKSVGPEEVIPDKGQGNKPLASTQQVPWGILAVGGYYNCGRSTRVGWIVDTGIQLDHPDLNVDQTLSKTFVRTGIDSLTPNDYHGHGTHVAGIVAAKDNDFGVVGVAAGNKVAAVKVLSSSGWGWDSDIIAGLDYISKRGKPGDVVNMSLGGEVAPALDQAVVALGNKGFLVVLAAGNSRIDAKNFSPARANGRNIYTVSAHDINDNFASFSNFGNPPIDYCAPGVSVYSTYKNGSYATMSGTSMAAPHVAGILLANNKVVFIRGTVKSDPDYVPDRLASRTPR